MLACPTFAWSDRIGLQLEAYCAIQSCKTLDGYYALLTVKSRASYFHHSMYPIISHLKFTDLLNPKLLMVVTNISYPLLNLDPITPDTRSCRSCRCGSSISLVESKLPYSCHRRTLTENTTAGTLLGTGQSFHAESQHHRHIELAMLGLLNLVRELCSSALRPYCKVTR